MGVEWDGVGWRAGGCEDGGGLALLAHTEVQYTTDLRQREPLPHLID